MQISLLFKVKTANHFSVIRKKTEVVLNEAIPNDIRKTIGKIGVK